MLIKTLKIKTKSSEAIQNFRKKENLFTKRKFFNCEIIYYPFWLIEYQINTNLSQDVGLACIDGIEGEFALIKKIEKGIFVEQDVEENKVLDIQVNEEEIKNISEEILKKIKFKQDIIHIKDIKIDVTISLFYYHPFYIGYYLKNDSELALRVINGVTGEMERGKIVEGIKFALSSYIR